MDLNEIIKELQTKGYDYEYAVARVCQDIVLKGISQSDLSRNVTIKGGVVMRSMTQNIRRATLDIDIDFIKYSLSDDAINQFIKKINCVDGIKIEKVGEIEELNQQDYKGKRVYIIVSDSNDNHIRSKIDLGVHKRYEIKQEEFCFDISFDEDGAYLLINSKEQMFTEKLRSLIKFGRFSTRYKDIFDMYYQCNKMNKQELNKCINNYIFEDPGMRENNMEDIIKRVRNIFSDDTYKKYVDGSDKRWLDDGVDVIFKTIIEYLQSL